MPGYNLLVSRSLQISGLYSGTRIYATGSGVQLICMRGERPAVCKDLPHDYHSMVAFSQRCPDCQCDEVGLWISCFVGIYFSAFKRVSSKPSCTFRTRGVQNLYLLEGITSQCHGNLLQPS